MLVLQNGTIETMYVLRNTKYYVHLVCELDKLINGKIGTGANRQLPDAEFYYNGSYAGMMYHKYYGASFIQESIDNAKKERSAK